MQKKIPKLQHFFLSPKTPTPHPQNGTYSADPLEICMILPKRGYLCLRDRRFSAKFQLIWKVISEYGS
jgi:hypothetical protein